MRIERIYIDGFGRFVDREIGPLEPGLVVMHGENESGKTTLHRFIRAILFGFPHHSHHDYIDAFAGGQHGGSITLRGEDGETYIVERYRAGDGRAALTMPDGSAGGEAELRGLLGKATSDVYDAVFALNLDDLQTHRFLSNEAVKSLIYGAGLGAERLPDTIRKLEEQANDIFRPQGRLQPVPKVIEEIQELEADLHEVQAEAENYYTALDEREQLDREIAAQKENVHRVRRERDDLNRWIADLERLTAQVAQCERDAGRILSGVAGGWNRERLEQIGDLEIARRELEDHRTRLHDARGKLQIAEQALERSQNEHERSREQVEGISARIEQQSAGSIPPERLNEVESTIRRVRDLRARLDALEHAAQPRSPSGSGAVLALGVILFFLGVIAAAGGILAGLTVLSALEAGLIVAVASVAFLLPGLVLMIVSRRRAPATQTQQPDTSALRRELEGAATPLQIDGVPTDADIDRIERECAAARGIESLERERQTAESALAGRRNDLQSAQMERDRAQTELNLAHSEWSRWLAGWDLPHDTTPEAAGDVFRQLENAKSAIDRERAAKAELDQLRETVADKRGECTPESLKQDYQAVAERLNVLEEELARNQRRSGELHATIERLASDRTAAELRAQRAAKIAELQDYTREWATARLGLKVLERVRGAYEGERQPAVIRSASDAFASITEGRYRQVIPQVESGDGVEVLGADGRRKTVDQLSQGTLEQLYLAMRIGLIREFGERARPLPVLLDDVLVNFDVGRAAATAQTLHELSRDHQAIVFTCHPATIDHFKRSGPTQIITLDEVRVSS
ncbi:MAG: AAA family ATPase [Chloroflexota bacterium]